MGKKESSGTSTWQPPAGDFEQEQQPVTAPAPEAWEPPASDFEAAPEPVPFAPPPPQGATTPASSTGSFSPSAGSQPFAPEPTAPANTPRPEPKIGDVITTKSAKFTKVGEDPVKKAEFNDYRSRFAHLDAAGVEQKKTQLKEQKRRLDGIMSGFSEDAKQLEFANTDLLGKKQQVEAEGATNPASIQEFEAERVRYNGMVESLQKQRAAIEDLAGAVNRDYTLTNLRDYEIKANTGSGAGAFYNSMLNGVGSMAAGTESMIADALVSVVPLSALTNDKSKTKEDVIRDINRTIIADMRGVPKEMAEAAHDNPLLSGSALGLINNLVDSKGTTNEYVDRIKKGEDVGAALLGVAETIPALAVPNGVGMMVQASDMAMQEMERPAFDGVPQWKRRLFASTYGATIGRLETIGFRNIAARSPFVKRIFAEAVKEIPQDATAEVIKKTLGERMELGVKAYLKDVALAGASEYETGFMQSMAENALKDAFNEMEGRDLFKTPEGWSGYIQDAVKDGVLEAIGGAFFAQPFAISSAMRGAGLGSVATDAQFETAEKILADDQFAQPFEDDLKHKEETGAVTPAEAEQVRTDFATARKVHAKIPEGLSVEKRRQAFDILMKMDALSKKDPNLVPGQMEALKLRLQELAGVKPEENGTETTKPAATPSVGSTGATSAVSYFQSNGFTPKLKPNGVGEFMLQVDDTKPGGKRSSGAISLKTVEVDGEKLLSIGMTNVREGYEGKGLATNMYRYLMENLPEGHAGILSPIETRWNKEQVPAIHEKLSKEYTKTISGNGDIIFHRTTDDGATTGTDVERNTGPTVPADGRVGGSAEAPNAGTEAGDVPPALPGDAGGYVQSKDPPTAQDEASVPDVAAAKRIITKARLNAGRNSYNHDIYLSFDATGQPPTEGDLRKALLELGEDPKVVRVYPVDFHTAVSGEVNARIETKTAEDAERIYKKLFGTTDHISNPSAVEQNYPLGEALGRVSRYAQAKETAIEEVPLVVAGPVADGDGTTRPYLSVNGKYSVSINEDGQPVATPLNEVEDTWSKIKDPGKRKAERKRVEVNTARGALKAEKELAAKLGITRVNKPNALKQAAVNKQEREARNKAVLKKANSYDDTDLDPYTIALRSIAGGKKVLASSVARALGWSGGKNTGNITKWNKKTKSYESVRDVSDEERNASWALDQDPKAATVEGLAHSLYENGPRDAAGDPLYDTSEYRDAILSIVSGYKSADDAVSALEDALPRTPEEILQDYEDALAEPDYVGVTEEDIVKAESTLANATDEELAELWNEAVPSNSDEEVQGPDASNNDRQPTGAADVALGQEEPGRSPSGASQAADPEADRLQAEVDAARNARDAFVNDFNDRGQGLFAPEDIPTSQTTIDDTIDNSKENFDTKVEPLNERVRQAQKALADYVEKGADRAKAAAQQTAIPEADEPFNVDDNLILTSPDGLSTMPVSFRGREGNNAIVWTGRSQMSVPLERLSRPAPKLAEPADMTDASVINRDYRKLVDSIGEKKAKKYFEQVDRLFNPNTNKVVEYRANGVVTEKDGKRTFHALADMDMKEWRVSFSSLVADQTEAPTTKTKAARTEAEMDALKAKLAEQLKKFGKGGSTLSSGGVDPKLIEEATEIMHTLVQMGYVKLKQIIEQLKALGMDHMVPAAKEAYQRLRDTFEHSNEIKQSFENDTELARQESEDGATARPGVANAKGKRGLGKQPQFVGTGRNLRGRPNAPNPPRPLIRIAGDEDLATPRKERVAEGTYEIDEHQRLGVNLALERFADGHKAFMLGDGVGVGKTREILVIAEEFRKETGKKVLIITKDKRILADSFKNDSATLGIDLSNFTVGIYNDLTSKDPIKGEFGLVIFDESHMLKNFQSKRAQASEKLSVQHIAFVTATPFDKPETSIRYLRDLTGLSQGEVMSRLGVEFRYITDQYTGEVGVITTLKNGKDSYWKAVQEMRSQLVKDGGFVRREYPFFGDVEFTDLDAPPSLAADIAAVQGIASKIEENAEYEVMSKWASARMKARGEFGPNTNERRALEKMLADKAPGIEEEYRGRYSRWLGAERKAQIAAIDQLNEVAKVPLAVERTKEALAKGEKVVLVVQGVNEQNPSYGTDDRTYQGKPASGRKFKEYGYFTKKLPGAGTQLGAALKKAGIGYGAIWTGANDMEAFNAGDVDVLVMTATSGGTGINLDDRVGDAPRRMIMLTPPWGGDSFEQLIGRTSRRNTVSPSKVEVLAFKDNRADASRKRHVVEKRKTLKAINEGVDPDEVRMMEDEGEGDPDVQFQLGVVGKSSRLVTDIAHVDKVITALSSIAPGIKITVHQNGLEYIKEAYAAGVIGDNGAAAFYNATANEIHILEEAAKDNTLFHEAAHPVLSAAVSNNPSLVDSLYEELSARPDFAKYKKFGQQYAGTNLQKVEAIVEFMADVASGKVEQAADPKSLYQRLKNWLKDLLAKLGFSPNSVKLDPANLKRFAGEFARAVREGVRIDGAVANESGVFEQRLPPEQVAANMQVRGMSSAEADQYLDSKGVSPEDKAAIMAAFGEGQQASFDFTMPEMPKGSAQEMFDKQLADAKAHRKKFSERLYNWYVKGFEDTRGVIKGLLREAGAAEAVIRLNLVSGASGAAKAKFTDLHKKIHGGLNSIEKTVLNNIIQARRTISIDNRYDGILEDRKKHPGGHNKESMEKWLADLEAKHPAQFKKLNTRATAYFDAMSDMLKMKHKEGVISDELYDKLRNDEYSPREFIHHLIDSEEKMTIGTTDIGANGIKKLADGSEESLFNNSEWLLANQVASAYKLTFNNRANKALYEFAENSADQDIAYVLDPMEEPKSGFQEISHYKDGQLRRVAVVNEIATPWLSNSPIIKHEAANFFRVATGGAFFRVMVTGANITFALANVPRDVGHVLMFTGTYSSMLPKALMQLGADVGRVAGDALKRKGRFKEYVEEGGNMDFLTRQGKPLSEGDSFFSHDAVLHNKGAFERGLDAFMHVAGYINETSELIVRLAIRERELNTRTDAFIAENGRQPTPDELKWIKEQSTAAAREQMDFNQGGEWAKALDTFIPYLNASFQGTRVMARYAKTNPKVFALKLAQLAGLTTAIIGYNLSFGDDWDDIDDETKENNFIFFLPWTRTDENGVERRSYLTIPKSQDQRVFTSFFENLAEYQATGKYPTKRSIKALKNAIPIGPTTLTRIPIVDAIDSYRSGYDSYRDKYVVDPKADLEPFAEYTVGRTPSLYRDIGMLMASTDKQGNTTGGLSPARMQLAMEKYTGVNENNLFFVLLTKPYNLMTDGLDKEGKAEVQKGMTDHLKDVANPFMRRYMRETNPRGGMEVLERHSRADQTRRKLVNDQAKELLNAYYQAETPEQRSEVNKLARERFSHFGEQDRERATENYNNGRKLKGVPWEFIKMKSESLDVRARAFYEIYRMADGPEKAKMIEYSNKAELFTDAFLERLKVEAVEFERAMKVEAADKKADTP